MRKSLLALLTIAVCAASAPACDEMGELRQAMTSARAGSTEMKWRSFQRTMVEANLLKDLMEDYLTLVYFPGLYGMRDDAFQITAGSDAAYAAVSARVGFLRAQPGTRITLNAGSGREAQFEAINADYVATLERAGAALRALGGSPDRYQPLWALTEWGAESVVMDGTRADRMVVTAEQKGRILARNAAPSSDPRE